MAKRGFVKLEHKELAQGVPDKDMKAYQPVTSRNGIYKGEVSDTVETVTLVPYGCTKVRIVAFPVVK